MGIFLPRHQTYNDEIIGFVLFILNPIQFTQNIPA